MSYGKVNAEFNTCLALYLSSTPLYAYLRLEIPNQIDILNICTIFLVHISRCTINFYFDINRVSTPHLVAASGKIKAYGLPKISRWLMANALSANKLLLEKLCGSSSNMTYKINVALKRVQLWEQGWKDYITDPTIQFSNALCPARLLDRLIMHSKIRYLCEHKWSYVDEKESTPPQHMTLADIALLILLLPWMHSFTDHKVFLQSSIPNILQYIRYIRGEYTKFSFQFPTNIDDIIQLAPWIDHVENSSFSVNTFSRYSEAKRLASVNKKLKQKSTNKITNESSSDSDKIVDSNRNITNSVNKKCSDDVPNELNEEKCVMNRLTFDLLETCKWYHYNEALEKLLAFTGLSIDKYKQVEEAKRELNIDESIECDALSPRGGGADAGGDVGARGGIGAGGIGARSGDGIGSNGVVDLHSHCKSDSMQRDDDAEKPFQTLSEDFWKQLNLPEKRLERKKQQILSLARLVVAQLPRGGKAIEFCCGGGYVGLAVAHLRPDASIILTDRNSVSLAFAKQRILELGLSNVSIQQCDLHDIEIEIKRICFRSVNNATGSVNNVREKIMSSLSTHGDGYGGDGSDSGARRMVWIHTFDVGIALHACGRATDIVQNICTLTKASFVLSPCCYGFIQHWEEIAAQEVTNRSKFNASAFSAISANTCAERDVNIQAKEEKGLPDMSTGTYHHRSTSKMASSVPKDRDRCMTCNQIFEGCKCCDCNHYPRSQLYKTSGWKSSWFGELCSRADRTFWSHDDRSALYDKDARIAMKIIDNDRLMSASERNYDVCATSMYPPEASPKNHILIGNYLKEY